MVHQIETVVLDVDGVLVRDGMFAALLEERGLTREATGFFHGGPFAECVLGKADLRESISPFLSDWGWSDPVDDLLRLWFEADSAVNAEILDVVSHLRGSGLGCYVASTQESHRADYLTDALGFGRLFDGLFFSCHLGMKKPDEAFYVGVAERIGSPPERILFLDDHQVNVDGARVVGWNAEIHHFGDDVRETLREYQL
ncbi:MAG: HAD-IA family hydrolase [Actinomycetota bacterium]